MNAPLDFTQRVRAWRAGDAAAADALNAEVYALLKRMAQGRLAGQPAATLNPTALVHEAVLRLLDGQVDAQSRTHFYALVALQMRAVLVDHARRRSAQKRGAGAAPVTLDDALAQPVADADALLDLHTALEQLASEDPRAARAVELTYFGGLAAPEVALVLEVSDATVERDLKFARAWLHRRLSR